jgi:hypothetical protein
MFLVEHAENLFPLNPQNGAIVYRGCRCRSQALIRGDASFTQEIALAEQRNRCFLALFGQNAESNPAVLDPEDCVRTLTLGKDDLLRAIVKKSPADTSSC